MAKLTRYNCGNGEGMFDHPNGEWIKHSDHTKLIERVLSLSESELPFKIERILVVVAQRWGKDYPGSTVGIIGREAIEVCEKHGIDWENYK